MDRKTCHKMAFPRYDHISQTDSWLKFSWNIPSWTPCLGGEYFLTF